MRVCKGVFWGLENFIMGFPDRFCRKDSSTILSTEWVSFETKGICFASNPKASSRYDRKRVRNGT